MGYTFSGNVLASPVYFCCSQWDGGRGVSRFNLRTEISVKAWPGLAINSKIIS